MITIDKNKCPQNHRCPSINVCPVGAISQNGFELPIINQELCVECGKCIKFCPRKAIQKVV
jgi:Fe-S-cluster-containing hydrogenase component 2